MIGLTLVVLAVLPYSTMKIVWLAGSSVGVTDPPIGDDLHSAAMTTGNAITLGMEVVGVLLAIALTRPWSHRVPAPVVFVIAGGATGLLAPIALGFPTGLVIQYLSSGTIHTSGMDHMSMWVFAVAYCGFCVLALGFAILLGHYCVERWGHFISAAPARPTPTAVAVGAIGLLPYAATMIWWGVVGPGSVGPTGMTATSQRSFLVFTGVLALAGFLGSIGGELNRRFPRTAWLAVWVGCATAVMQPLTSVLLNFGGDPSPVFAVLCAITVPCAFGYGLWLLRSTVRSTSGGAATSLTNE